MKNKITAIVCSALLGICTHAQASELTALHSGIIPIAAYTANGNTVALKSALVDGLQTHKMTVNEIKEVLIQMYAYTGFPRSLTGLGVLVNILKERKAQGIEDIVGRSASPLPDGKTIREIGTEVQTKLVGHPVSGPVYDFAPEIDTYLKEHLFGDIFASDVLDWKARELATVSALAALPAPNQLRSHLNVCLNVGWSANALREFVHILQAKVGQQQAELASQTLEEVLRNRKSN